jgi:hypothetical protein
MTTKTMNELKKRGCNIENISKMDESELIDILKG